MVYISREDAALGAFFISTTIAALTAWVGVGNALQTAVSLLIVLSFGAVLGSIKDHEEEEGTARMAIPFLAVGGLLLFASIVILAVYPFASPPFLGVEVAGSGAFGISWIFLFIGVFLDEEWNDDGVPDDPEAILDDGGDA